jgi:translation initiation factor IF-2
MSDSAGKPVRQAYPGMAVTVSGWKELPNAGDEVLTGPELDVKKALANRQRTAEAEATLIDMEAINTQRMEERRKVEGGGEEDEKVQEVVSGPKELRLVIKGDVSGSVEALEGALQGIGNKDAVVKIVSTGVGDVSESDVMMAKAAEGWS